LARCRKYLKVSVDELWDTANRASDVDQRKSDSAD